MMSSEQEVKRWLSTILRRLLLCVAGVSLLLLATGSASASNIKIVSYDQVLDKETDTFSFPAANRCVGEPRTIKLTSHGSFRITMVTSGPDAGFYWITPIQKGTFVVLSTAAGEPDYTGQFELQPDNHIAQDGEVTYFLHLVGTGTDGSHLDARLLEHLSISKDKVTISLGSPVFLSQQLDCA